MKQKFRSFEELLDEYLDNPEFAMSFLNQALADDDVEAFKLSLTNIIQAHETTVCNKTTAETHRREL